MYEKMLAEYKRLEKEIKKLKKRLVSYPEGKLICVHNGKYTKWFVSNGSTKTYIPKKNRVFAERLAEKKYLEAKLNDMNAEKQAIGRYLRYHKEGENKLLMKSGYLELLPTSFFNFNESALAWMQASYEKNTSYPQGLRHQAVNGEMVRSKSESMIVKVLMENKIPFRYECRLDLNEGVVYPDFTIMHPRTGELRYWEHFGMMDKANYRNKAIYKLQRYCNNGILPGIHLIMSFESEDEPLSYEKIEALIQIYFK